MQTVEVFDHITNEVVATVECVFPSYGPVNFEGRCFKGIKYLTRSPGNSSLHTVAVVIDLRQFNYVERNAIMEAIEEGDYEYATLEADWSNKSVFDRLRGCLIKIPHALRDDLVQFKSK